MPGQRLPPTLHPTETQYLVALGARIRQLREQRGLGVEELASRAGVHRTHLWKIEKGQLNAGVISYVRLARELHLAPGALLPEVGTEDREIG